MKNARRMLVGLGAMAMLPVAAAGAQTPSSAGGASPTEPPPPARATTPATIGKAACTTNCPTLALARPGSTIRVDGQSLQAVKRVVFLGRKGNKDDVSAPVSAATPTTVDVVIPPRARSGRLRTINTDGKRSKASTSQVQIRPKAKGPAVQARVKRKKAFAGPGAPAQLDVLTQQPYNVTVAIIRVADGAPIAAFPLGVTAPGVVRNVQWDGAVAGVPQAPGKYEFRVYSNTEGTATAAAAPPPMSRPFELVDHAFPIDGAHKYGTGAATFGGGRGHQGFDVFANCGTPLRAARGGTVKFAGFHSRAGNYLVVSGAGTGLDYVYMHMRDKVTLKKGQSVSTGQPIGVVGQTGRASGCHLHFELWTAPGWQSGGSPIDPFPLLKAWDG